VSYNFIALDKSTTVDASSASETLPFTLQDLKASIPAYCFEPSVWRSLSYFFLDVGIIAALYAIAHLSMPGGSFLFSGWHREPCFGHYLS
jgi:omega-3 fatty acid desaturase (delta-15 desaturase)